MIAWANPQAALLRAGRFDELDIEEIWADAAGAASAEAGLSELPEQCPWDLDQVLASDWMPGEGSSSIP